MQAIDDAAFGVLAHEADAPDLPREIAEASAHLDAVLEEVDVVMMLRIQLERHDDAGGGAIPPDYRSLYGLTIDRVDTLPAGVPVMHPGPMNRGVEIDSEVADDPDRNIIMGQVTNGVAVRMAVLKRAIRQ